VVAYPGIDAERFTSVPGQNDRQIVERYGIKGEYLLFLGTLEPRKNITGLIAAYTHLPRKITDKYALVLAGSRGWNDFEIQSVLNDAREKGYRILTPGKIAFENLPALYRSARAFAFLSHYEGFGIPPLEAMACGTPVIASDIPTIRESLGDCALLVKPDDRQAATAAIERILTDKKLREKLIPSGIARAATFDWQTSARKILVLVKRSS
jgi:glycosyltransferase involved in cell wall biosynthesis